MTRRAACSDRAVVKCAHSASTSAIFDFACSVLFGMLHFFGFFASAERMRGKQKGE